MERKIEIKKEGKEMRKFTFAMVAVMLVVFFAQSASVLGYDKMLKKPKAEICAMCHSDKAKYFDESGHGKFKVVCQMCHNPHGEGVNAMLKWPEETFCLQCHGKMKEHYGNSGHGKIGVLCQQCHDPHGTKSENEAAAPAAKPAVKK